MAHSREVETGLPTEKPQDILQDPDNRCVIERNLHRCCHICYCSHQQQHYNESPSHGQRKWAAREGKIVFVFHSSGFLPGAVLQIAPSVLALRKRLPMSAIRLHRHRRCFSDRSKTQPLAKAGSKRTHDAAPRPHRSGPATVILPALLGCWIGSLAGLDRTSQQPSPARSAH